MKTKMFALYPKLISLCLLILGFGACNDDDPSGGGGGAVEYGVPSAKYKVSGKVVTSEASKKPIANIRVIMYAQFNSGSTQDALILRDTVYTNAEGRFEINKENFPHNTFNIDFKDFDGETNGSFEDKTQKIEFKASDYKNGGTWYKGLAQKDMGTVEITPKPKAE